MDSQLQRHLYASMLRIRLIEEAIAVRYAEQEMRCPVHLSVGQEGVAVGVCAALEPQDYVMSTHRAHAHYLAKGGSLKALLAELYGKATGCSGGKGGSMHLVDLSANMLGATPIVGSCLPVTVGTAWGAQMKGENRVSVAFFGEGGTEEGVFVESLNFAALKKLPVIFLCENNLYSVYSPLSVRQSEGRDRAMLARAHNIPAVCDDGNDVEAVYRATREAVTRARFGGGPAYLEFATYRWREHCGPNFDNHIGYRAQAEYEVWRKRCPVETYEAQLQREGVLTAQAIAELRVNIEKEIDEAFAFAKASPFPSVEALYADVYYAGANS